MNEKYIPSQEERSAFVGSVRNLLESDIVGGGIKLVQVKAKDFSFAVISEDKKRITKANYLKNGNEFILSSVQQFENTLWEQNMWNPDILKKTL
jgi:hypothetical protein